MNFSNMRHANRDCPKENRLRYWNVVALLLMGYMGGCCVGCGVNGSLFTRADPFHASVETSTDAAKVSSLTEAKATSQSKTSHAKTSSSSAASRPLIKKIFRPTAKKESSSNVRVVKLPQQPKIPTEVIEQTPATTSRPESADDGTNADKLVTDSAAETSSASSESSSAETTSAQELEPTQERTESEEPKSDTLESDDVAATTPSVVDEQTPSTQGSSTVTAIYSEIAATKATPMVAMHGNMPVTLETLTPEVVTPTAAEEHAAVSSTATVEEKSLTVQQLSLVREVKGFGKKVAFTNQSFRPGQSVILYAEVDRFETILDQNGYYTALRGVVVMRDMNDRIVFRQEPSVAEETCESKRRDYYLAQILTFPENLSIGRYRLEFFVEDCCSGRYGSATIEIEIR